MVTKKIKKICIAMVACISLHSINQTANKKVNNIANIKRNLAEGAKAQFTHKKDDESNRPWINIFIHGIISAAPVLSFETMHQIRGDKISNTLYEYYVENVRSNRFFCKNQTMQEMGLKEINTTRKDADDGCPATAKLFDIQYNWSYPEHNIKNYYYTFGWSGFINKRKMYQDAKIFCKQYIEEIKKFHAKGIYPKTRIIGFSHGGSEALQIGAFVQNEKINTNFSIDELILLGMPIMDDIDHYVNASIFKKIYSFYSGSDRIQVLDFSHPKNLFSRRKFRNRKKLKLPDKLIQVRLEMFRALPNKSGWGFSKTSRAKRSKITRHSRALRKSSPGHCEWWFFGWTNKYYRDNFALAPLSITSVIPTIITKLESSNVKPVHSRKFGNQITVQLKPFEESITIINKNKKEKVTFLTNNQFDILKNITKEYPFEKITSQRYGQEVDKELKKAKTRLAKYNEEHSSSKKRCNHRMHRKNRKSRKTTHT